MSFDVLKSQIECIRNNQPRKKRIVLLDKSKFLYYFGFCNKKILHALCYEDWNVEELENGRWRVFYEERGEKSFISEYASEDEACDAFLKTIMKSTLR